MPPESGLAGLRRLFSNRGSRKVLLGGFATACVVVIAVSTFFLVPPGQRQVLVPPRVTPRVVDTNPRQPPAKQRVQATQPPATPEDKTELQPPEVVTSPEPAKTEHTPIPRATHSQKSKPSGQPTLSPDTTPLEPIGPPAVDEIVVERRAYAPAISTPSPIAATAQPAASPSPDVAIQEVVTTGARRQSWLNRMFSRNAPAPIPQSFQSITEGRDKFEHFEVNPVKQVSAEPVSTFSADVDTASYSFVRRELNQGHLPQVDSVRVEEMINYFDYTWPASDSRDQPFKPTVTVSDSPWGEGKKLIHIGIKGYELPVKQQPDVNLVLLLDVSGSMDQPDKLPLAQQSMALLLDTLRPTDTVAIVVYAGAAGEVLPPTPIKEKETILQALNSLQPGGSTAGAEGIKLAYALAERSFRKNGVNRILLATDGDFNVGITNTNELKGFVEREREKGVFLSFLGFRRGQLSR